MTYGGIWWEMHKKKRRNKWAELGEELQTIPSLARESDVVLQMGGGQDNYAKAFKPQDRAIWVTSLGVLDSKYKVLVSRVPLNNSQEVTTTYVMMRIVEASNGQIPSSSDCDESKTTKDNAV